MTSKAVAQYEDRKQDIIVKDFGGVNLSAHRTQIGKDEFAWLENLIPLGPANLVVTPAAGTPIALANVAFMAYVNLIGDFLVAVQQNGTISLVALATGTVTGVTGGISPTSIAIAQWKNERVIVVDPTNYRSIGSNDGLVFLNGYVVALTITNAGAGYTSAPTVSFSGGGGSGAAASVNLQLNGTQTISNAGTGYTAGDILTLNGGAGGKLHVDTIGGGGTVTAVSIYASGNFPGSSLPTPPVGVTGGTGTGATFTLLYNVLSLAVTTGATVPYVSAPTVAINGGGFSVQATATATILAGPVGTTVASFSGRVFVGNNRTVSYSAPDSWFDFTAANAGGSFIMEDETLEASINQLVAANGFLYIIGNTSIDTLSDVRVISGSPPVTVFSKVNISPQIGSQFGQKNPVIPFGKALVWSARFGIYNLLGSTPSKVSQKLDLLMKAVTVSGGQFLGSGVCKLYGALVPAFLVSYPDGSASGTRTLIILLYQGRWFFVTQGTPTLLAGATVSGDQRIYASDGTNIYQVFGETTNASTISWKVTTALWPMSTPISDKQLLKCAVEISPIDSPLVVVPGPTTDVPVVINVSLENERGVLIPPVVLNASTGQWQNASGATGSWVNGLGAVGDWMLPGFNVLQADAETKGRYVGYTLTGSTRGFTINGILGQYEERAKWNASGVS